MANIGLMHLERIPSAQVSPSLLDNKLNDGYVYCAYYWNLAGGGQQGHAVVIYGVDAHTVYFSDPAPARGLTKAPTNFFRRQSAVVALGTSLLADLRRGIDQAARRLGGTR
jgi:hypothetical protein